MKCPQCNSDIGDDSKFCKECGTNITSSEDAQPAITKTIETPREELTTGSTFAERYQIIEELGKGGMGKVYKAIDTDIKEKVAIKLIKPEISTDKKTIERFRNELKFARKIRHKNVCQMYDLNREEGIYYISMEYVSGEDLKSFIRRSRQLAIGTAITIAKQICDGLSEAHKVGVVHRDLKPNNIMIDRDGEVRIMDFGIARSLKEKGITGAGVMIGTPEYMSPEQVESKETDQRSDIYSLGIILYEMVTGQVPFEGDTPFSIGVKQKSENPRPPKEINDQIPEDLNRVILKCMEKEKESRYQGAGELHSELMKLEKGIPTAERAIAEKKPLTSREITVTFGLKKLVIPVSAFIAVVLIGLLVWHPWSRERAIPPPPSDKPSLVVMYFENNTGDETLDHWRKGISDLLITDLTQSKYLKVLGGDRLFDILGQMGQLEARSYSSQVLKELAAQGEVNHIARGSYSKAGDILRIDIVLQDAQSGEPIATQSVEGKGEEAIFAMVDDLTNWTKANLKLSSDQIAGDLDKQIGTVTTSSPEAYKFYAEGIRLFNKRNHQQSIDSLGKAIALDPGFAMAYRKMAVAFGNMGERDKEKKYMDKALELSDRLTEREKFLIQGSYFGSSDSTYDKAIEAYEKLIALYPESGEAIAAYHNLGLMYGRLEDWDKAIECDEAAIEGGSKNLGLRVNLASHCMAAGEYQKAEKVLKDSIDLFPDNALGHWQLAKLYAFQGRFELALDEVDKAAAINPTSTKAQFYHMMWDFEKAEEEYQKWLGHVSQRTHLEARLKLGYLYQTQGKFQEAKNQTQLGMDLAELLENKYGYLEVFIYELAYLYMRDGKYVEALEAVEKIEISMAQVSVYHLYDLELEGMIYTEMGELDKARNTAKKIKGMVEASLYKKRIRHYYFLMGMIELKTKNYSEAIDSFKKAVSLLPHPVDFITDDGFYRYCLAQAYQESGDLRAARDEFEGLVGFIPGRNSYGDLYAESYYKLGQIYEQLGNSTKAMENFEKFLDLWKDADPGLPEVADARERVAKLKQ